MLERPAAGERAVIVQLDFGCDDIAEQLDLSEGTVKIHVTAVFKALGVNSRTQALVTVARYGIDFGNVF